MDRRPLSATVICGLLALNAFIGSISVVVLLFAHLAGATGDAEAHSHLPMVTDMVILSIDTIVFLAYAIGLYYRQGWMRLLLLGWAAAFLIHGLLAMHLQVYRVMRLLIFVGVVSIFLFGAKENAWFSGKNLQPPVQPS
ncbi:MAG: hypothetical protein KGL13_00260 [Gammaproteobacteria bacterium]|nr:hypothetical protein [Gammaproteobacteria bacterium]MDE2344875.1 hypothetical protein [Gammaproteobacteria bacterium]